MSKHRVTVKGLKAKLKTIDQAQNTNYYNVIDDNPYTQGVSLLDSNVGVVYTPIKRKGLAESGVFGNPAEHTGEYAVIKRASLVTQRSVKKD
jgi:hypothetical protein